MLMDAKKISAIIRAKKKAMLTAPPELAGTSPNPDMNAQDVYDMEMEGRMQTTLKSEPRINADDTMMNDTDDGMGVTEEQKKRMPRLRAYIETMDLGSAL